MVLKKTLIRSQIELLIGRERVEFRAVETRSSNSDCKRWSDHKLSILEAYPQQIGH